MKDKWTLGPFIFVAHFIAFEIFRWYGVMRSLPKSLVGFYSQNFIPLLTELSLRLGWFLLLSLTLVVAVALLIKVYRVKNYLWFYLMLSIFAALRFADVPTTWQWAYAGLFLIVLNGNFAKSDRKNPFLVGCLNVCLLLYFFPVARYLKEPQASKTFNFPHVILISTPPNEIRSMDLTSMDNLVHFSKAISPSMNYVVGWNSILTGKEPDELKGRNILPVEGSAVNDDLKNSFIRIFKDKNYKTLFQSDSAKFRIYDQTATFDKVTSPMPNMVNLFVGNINDTFIERIFFSYPLSSRDDRILDRLVSELAESNEPHLHILDLDTVKNSQSIANLFGKKLAQANLISHTVFGVLNFSKFQRTKESKLFLPETFKSSPQVDTSLVDSEAPEINSLWLHLPGQSEQTIDQKVGLIDLFPSIVDYLKFPPLDVSGGRSFFPLLQGKTISPRSYYCESSDWYFSKLRADRWAPVDVLDADSLILEPNGRAPLIYLRASVEPQILIQKQRIFHQSDVKWVVVPKKRGLEYFRCDERNCQKEVDVTKIPTALMAKIEKDLSALNSKRPDWSELYKMYQSISRSPYSETYAEQVSGLSVNKDIQIKDFVNSEIKYFCGRILTRDFKSRLNTPKKELIAKATATNTRKLLEELAEMGPCLDPAVPSKSLLLFKRITDQYRKKYSSDQKFVFLNRTAESNPGFERNVEQMLISDSSKSQQLLSTIRISPEINGDSQSLKTLEILSTDESEIVKSENLNALWEDELRYDSTENLKPFFTYRFLSLYLKSEVSGWLWLLGQMKFREVPLGFQDYITNLLKRDSESEKLISKFQQAETDSLAAFRSENTALLEKAMLIAVIQKRICQKGPGSSNCKLAQTLFTGHAEVNWWNNYLQNPKMNIQTSSPFLNSFFRQ